MQGTTLIQGKKATIGVFAHVDAGKTTFSEQLLYHTQSIKERGRVDHKDAYLDNHEIERMRGITIFAEQAMMHYNGAVYYLVDTPGHVDFSPEMERAIQVMDYAIVMISAVEGIQGHTETVWQLLDKYRVPTFIFINKVDRVGADVNQVIEDIRKHWTDRVCPITDQLQNGEIEHSILEFVAEQDEALLDRFIAAEAEEEGFAQQYSFWLHALQEQIRNRQLFPCASGSALQDVGIGEFLDQLHLLTVTEYGEKYDEGDQAPFGGRVYKIRHDDHGARLTFVKALTGTLKVRDEVCYEMEANAIEQQREKVTRLLLFNGKKSQMVDEVHAGDLFAVVGLSAAVAGQGIGVVGTDTGADVTMATAAGVGARAGAAMLGTGVDEDEDEDEDAATGASKVKVSDRFHYELIPTLVVTVQFDASFHVKDVLRIFRMLEAEDPSLNVVWEETLQEIQVHIMGVIQLEVLQQLAKDRFQLEVSFGSPEILYKETIQSMVVGYGHFEPLRHYAEVHLRLEPGERGSGLGFASECHIEQLSTGHQNLIQTHLYEREHHGLLTGMTLTDIQVTLLTGAGHNEHTHGGDFREATYRALRQGLEKADNVLLEPYYRYKIRVVNDHLGRILSDIQKASGQFDPPQMTDTHVMITGRVPVATFMEYSTELASFTHGRGSIQLLFDGYDVCHNTEEVIARKGYNKDADPLYTSSSIFCAKGAGYSVSWQEAEGKMHLL